MPVYKLSEISREKRLDLLQRPVMNTSEIMSRVGPIMERVRKEGDQAVLALTEKFDGVKMSSVVLKPPFKYDVKEETKKAIDVAYSNIRSFHKKQLEGEGVVEVETMKVGLTSEARLERTFSFLRQRIRTIQIKSNEIGTDLQPPPATH